MVEPIPRDIPLDEKGNIDVLAELEILKTFREMGIDISDMENILFTDIDLYKEQRKRIIDLIDDEYIDLSDDDQIFPPTQSEGDPDDIDALLVGSPLDQGENLEVQIDLSNDMAEQNIPQKENPLEENNIDDDRDGTGSGTVSDEPEKEESMENIIPGDTEQIPEEEHREEQDNITRRTKYKGSKKPVAITLGVILLLLISGSIGYYFYDGGEDQKNIETISADFTISDINPLAGDIVNLSAEGSAGTLNYSWSVIPDDFSIRTGGIWKDNLEVLFHVPGEYRIDLTVSRNEVTEIKTRFIDVQNIDVGISRERYGDIYSYDINGHLEMNNIDRFFDEAEAKQLDNVDLNYWTEVTNPMRLQLGAQSTMSMDGLAYEYDRIERSTDQFLKFSGKISKKTGPSTTISGSSSTVQNTYVDLYTKRPVLTNTDVVMDFLIPVSNSWTIDRRIEQNIDLLPDLSRDFSELRIEDLSVSRSFSIGDKGTTKWGSITLSWQAVSADIISGETVIKLLFKMDESEKRSLDLELFEMEHWIDPDIPVPVMTHINISSVMDIENPYSMDHTQILVDYEMGEDIIYFGTGDHKHIIIGSIVDKYPVYDQDLHDNWDMLPKLGDFGGTFNSNNNPHSALEEVMKKPSFKTWHLENDDSFAISCTLSSYSDPQKWFFSIAETGEKWGYNATFNEDLPDTGTVSQITPIDISKNDISSIMTFSGAEDGFKKLIKEVDRDITTSIYGRSSPDSNDIVNTDEFNVGIRIEHDYPVVGLFNPFMYAPIEMCMVFESQDGSISVGFDMTNGQIAYIFRDNSD